MVLNLFASADPHWCCERFASVNVSKFFRLIDNLLVLHSFAKQLARAVLNTDNIKPKLVDIFTYFKTNTFNGIFAVAYQQQV